MDLAGCMSCRRMPAIDTMGQHRIPHPPCLPPYGALALYPACAAFCWVGAASNLASRPEPAVPCVEATSCRAAEQSSAQGGVQSCRHASATISAHRAFQGWQDACSCWCACVLDACPGWQASSPHNSDSVLLCSCWQAHFSPTITRQKHSIKNHHKKSNQRELWRRCLAALAEWERLASLIRREWSRMEPSSAREMAPVAAHAAWHMGHWQVLEPLPWTAVLSRLKS